MRDIVASMISDTQEEFLERLEKVKGKVDRIQLDIMDGVFVESEVMLFNFQIPEDIKKSIKNVEAHLMVINPEEWIGEHLDQVDTFIIHIETCNDPQKVIDFVKDKDKKIGFALRPETEPEVLFPYLDKLDLVLVFSANVIGYYGAKFDPKSLEKVKAIRSKSRVTIEVDGGVSPKNISSFEEAGANRFVVGSFLQKASDIDKAIEFLNQ
ncbi:hypothetical protein H6503_00675 [Candidatus Woesearchaeota archaeon]|nr:hypothetical protein [Candidatus Woesearchaeota archaeon]